MSSSPGKSRAATEPVEHDEMPGLDELVQLHRGEFATTYRARRADGTSTAVKVIHGLFGDSSTERRLRTELDRCRSVAEQPHLLQILDSGTTYAGRPYLATEFCPPGSLLDQLSGAHNGLRPEVVLDHVVPVAMTLHALHQAGLTYGQVEPGRILTGSDHRPLLGEPVTVWLRVDQPLPQDAARYAAPEILGGRRPDAASDQYSLAATTVHLLAGQRPGDSQPGLGQVEGSGSVHDLSPGLVALPAALAAVLTRALASDPGKRFPDMQAFAWELDRAAQTLSIQVGYSPVGFLFSDLSLAARAATALPERGAGRRRVSGDCGGCGCTASHRGYPVHHGAAAQARTRRRSRGGRWVRIRRRCDRSGCDAAFRGDGAGRRNR